MNRIIILNEELETQMRMYLALCNRYKVEIAEDEAMLMRMIRRKRPKLVFLDGDYSRNGKSVVKTVQKIKKKYHVLKIITVTESPRLPKDVQSDEILNHSFDEYEIQDKVSSLIGSKALSM